jgi:predicted nucleic acid-binding protein
MTVFVDTSALFALLDAADPAHAVATRCLVELHARRIPLVTHEFVVVETSALVQRRYADALHILHRRLLLVVDVVPVTRDDRDRATAALLAAPRGPSLVDRISFEVMRRDGLTEAFAFDRHFADEGFATLPA